jgi:hypothetical protein
MHAELRCPDGHVNQPPSVFCTTCGQALLMQGGLEVEDPGRSSAMGAGQRPTLAVPVSTPPAASPRFSNPQTVPRPYGPRSGGPDVSPPPRKIWPTVVIVVLAFLVRGSNAKSTGTGHLLPPPNPAPTHAPAAPAATNPEQEQASQLANLLGNSTVDRSQVVAAVADIANCGNLQSDETTLRQAQTSRQNLLTQLQSLALTSLPPGLTTDLSNAWSASASSDGYYAGWAADESTSFNGCTSNDTGDSNYQGASSSDVQATTAKDAFVTEWNPVAQQFGLTTYQANQL